MSGIPYYRYEGNDLSEKFAWVNGTPGMEAVAPAADSVRNMGQVLGGIADDAGRTMRDLGVSWTGPASDAAGRSTHQVVQNAAHTQGLAQNGADRMMDYGRSFEWLRSQVAYDDPAKYSTFQKFVDGNSEIASWVWPPVGDHVTIGERNQANDDIANRAFAQHEANTRFAEDGFATAGADPPPGAGPGAVSPGAAGAISGPGPGGAPHVATASAGPSGPSATGTPGPAPAVPAPVGATPAGAVPGGAVPGGALPDATGVPALAGVAPGANGTGKAGAPAAGTGTGSGTAGTGRAGAPDGSTAAAGLPGTAGRGTAPDAGPGRQRADLGQQFGNDLRSRGLGTPSAPGGAGVAAPYGGRYGEAFGRGPAGVDGRPAYGGPGAGRSPGYGGENGSRAAPGAPRSGAGLPGEGFGGRAGTVEPAVSGRAGAAGAGFGAGYAPLMGAGGMQSDGQGHHRNRYLLTSSEPFEVDVPYTPPVLGPDEDGEVPA